MPGTRAARLPSAAAGRSRLRPRCPVLADLCAAGRNSGWRSTVVMPCISMSARRRHSSATSSTPSPALRVTATSVRKRTSARTPTLQKPSRNTHRSRPARDPVEPCKRFDGDRIAGGQIPCLPGARIPAGSDASLIVSQKRR